MTVLSACQKAAVKLKQSRITALFSSTDPFPEELRLLADESATAIAQAYDWQKLLVLATLTGDASTEIFDMPADYDRMPKKARIHSKAFQNATFRKADDLDQWLWLKDTDLSGIPGNWIVIGGQMNIFPPMSSTETARFYYLSNLLVAPATGANKTGFTADSDTFRLPERLLTLDLVWRWKSQNGKIYDEDMKNFEIALSEEIGKDRGSNIITVGRQRIPANVTIAYPRALGA